MALSVKNKWRINMACSSVVLITLLITVGKWQAKKIWNTFDSTNINGRIELAESSQGGVKLKVSNMDTIFYFWANFLHIEDTALDFYRVAQAGDSVYKPAYSDTIKLITKENEYSFSIGGYNPRKR